MDAEPVEQAGNTGPEIELIIDLLERGQTQLLSEIHFASVTACHSKLRLRFDLVVTLQNRLGRKAA